MQKQDIIKIICLLIIISFVYLIIYKVYSTNKLYEGLISENITNNGVGAKSSGYASVIENDITQLKSSLSISSYRTNYENIILNTEEYLNITSLNKILNTDFETNDSVRELITQLNENYNAKIALNDIMKYIDSS
jgi:hypothetical protein